jgi:hypothetical protein
VGGQRKERWKATGEKYTDFKKNYYIFRDDTQAAASWTDEPKDGLHNCLHMTGGLEPPPPHFGGRGGGETNQKRNDLLKVKSGASEDATPAPSPGLSLSSLSFFDCHFSYTVKKG